MSPPTRHLSHVATRQVNSASVTHALGRQIADCLRPGDVLLLIGDLGAGKTTFVQGLAAGLGVSVPVTSPTFTLMRILECDGNGPVRRLLHADLYRLEDLREVADLGMLDLVDDGAVAAVEWGDAGEAVLGNDVLEVRFEPGERETDRIIGVFGTTSWTDRAGEIKSAMLRPV